MEDREEIEIIIETIEGILQKDIKETDENVYTIDGRQYKAIKNILKENENLKQASIINDRLYQEVCNKNKELEEENKKLNNANKTYINTIQNITPVLTNEYIRKSLIKEIIENHYPDVAIQKIIDLLGDEK